MIRIAAAALALVAIAGCGGGSGDEATTPAPVPHGIRLESPAFLDGGRLPVRFTCDGRGTSPPLRWTDVPSHARDLALVVEDPDAPGGGFTHWVAWKLPFAPAGRGRLLEGNVAPEVEQAKNAFGDPGWGPACPPEGDDPHHYVFTVYALDRLIGLGDGASADDVRDAIAASALAEGGLTATYVR